MVLILGDSESRYREIYTALQEEEKDTNKQYTSVVMKSEVKRRLTSRNFVASYDGDSEDTATVTSSGSYLGKTKRPRQKIIQNRVVCVKSKRGA